MDCVVTGGGDSAGVRTLLTLAASHSNRVQLLDSFYGTSPKNGGRKSRYPDVFSNNTECNA
jgi:hypothetical protein